MGDWVKQDQVKRYPISVPLLWYVRMPLILNTYQGIKNNYKLQNAKIDSACSFRLKYRNPFKKVCSRYNK